MMLASFFFMLTQQSNLLADSTLGPEDVLILVNENSPTSRYIARLYQEYYPDIDNDQILSLPGLTDCSGPNSTPADEIITRTDYNTHIATPLKNYLQDPNTPTRITDIRIIITTAGLPYRIEDTNQSQFGSVISPAGSSAIVVNFEGSINAASVESELATLWYNDEIGINNRVTNPYQGYRNSPIKLFNKPVPQMGVMSWTFVSSPTNVDSPIMEGTPVDFIGGIQNRLFHTGHIYLTIRLDGPKEQGGTPIFSVRNMLERSKRASDPLIGINPTQTVSVFDTAPQSGVANADSNRIFNLARYSPFNQGPNGETSGPDFWVFDPNTPQPPDAPGKKTIDDYEQGYTIMTGQTGTTNAFSFSPMPLAHDVMVVIDQRNNTQATQADLDSTIGTLIERDDMQKVITLATYGINGDESLSDDYLYATDPNSGIFNLTNGSIFTSFESYNAVTFFSDIATQPNAQGKIVDFMAIGGSGAIGHCFEPQSDAAIDNYFLFYNYIADHDDNGVADLTFVEAAYTAIPYLSWSEVVIGDPLMQIAFGPGGDHFKKMPGDTNLDSIINLFDLWYIKKSMGGDLNALDEGKFQKYNDRCDVNQDSLINLADLWLAKNFLKN